MDLRKTDTEKIKANGYILSHLDDDYEVYKKKDKKIVIKETVGLNHITILLGDESTKNYEETMNNSNC